MVLRRATALVTAALILLMVAVTASRPGSTDVVSNDQKVESSIA